ncbi:MAG: hypothetical protein H0T12_01700 [Actinobacteria bacterium]|nr:hypothetical protein [Actinomycetota bacterium]
MHRLVWSLVLLSLASVQTARDESPALTEVDLRGPGITGILTLSRSDFGVIRGPRSPAAVALNQLTKEHPLSPPAEKLGPRFDLVYHLALGLAPGRPRGAVEIRLYPYSQGGPLAFNPPLQARSDEGAPNGPPPFELRPGWYRYPAALVQGMQRHGLPSKGAAMGVLGRGTSANRLIGIALVVAFVLLSRRLRRHSVASPGPPTSG